MGVGTECRSLVPFSDHPPPPTAVLPTVTVLGTSAALPAHGRHLSATLVQWGARTVLLDCGEGTQFRLMDAGVSAARLDLVCITHWHGDHAFGLPGLLSTVALQGRTAPLVLTGPDGLAEALNAWPGIRLDGLPFSLDLRLWPHDGCRATDGRFDVWKDETLVVTARPLDHRVPTMGYRLEDAPRPGNLDADKARALGVTDFRDFRRLKAGHDMTTPDGKRVRSSDVVTPPPPPRAFAYALDTAPCDGARLLARNADLVLHDATFSDEWTARAAETGHSTARQAAAVAAAAGAKRLLLTHFSARHERTAPLVAEARSVFLNTDAAEELCPYVLD